MTSVFLDTVGLLAVWDKTDQWHGAANSVYSQLLREGRPVTTTPEVLLECGNAAARRPYRREVIELRQAFLAARLLIQPTDDELHEAWAAYERGEAGQAGIVDHVSFAAMRRMGLTEAFTNDRHFVAAGFAVLF